VAGGIDLRAYFDRIGFDVADGNGAPPAATYETLRRIQSRHAHAIPFENLNPFVGWPVRLDPDSLQQKLVRDRRGGYCFEHNLLLSHVLRTLGFDVRWLAARVVLSVPDNAVGGRTHMLLLVTVEGTPLVVDVGFGGLTLTAPLRLEAEIEQPTSHEPCRLIEAAGEFVMQAKIGAEWRPLYRFALQEQLLPDYEICNWYLSNHPQSRFVTTLIAARPDEGRRYALRNNELAVHHLGASTQRRVLRTAADVREALETLFLVNVPDAPAVHAALSRVASMPAPA
jgi:N-hydroxyarylamine O-acetyltransferase